MKNNPKRTTFINLFAGPGAGKSTICAEVFAKLKWLGVDCEMALEYAKDLVWSSSLGVLQNQVYIFGKQQNRLFRLNGKVDVVITDAPLLLSIVYNDQDPDAIAGPSFDDLVLREHKRFAPLNFFIERQKKYKKNGRLQDEQAAKEIDQAILDVFWRYSIPHVNLPGQPTITAERIVNDLFTLRRDLYPVNS